MLSTPTLMSCWGTGQFGKGPLLAAGEAGEGRPLRSMIGTRRHLCELKLGSHRCKRRMMKVRVIPPEELFLGLTITSTGLLIEIGLLVFFLD